MNSRASGSFAPENEAPDHESVKETERWPNQVESLRRRITANVLRTAKLVAPNAEQSRPDANIARSRVVILPDAIGRYRNVVVASFFYLGVFLTRSF